MKKGYFLSILLIVVSAGLAVFAYFILPEMVIIQFSAGLTENTTVPKLFAIMIPTALGIGGAVALMLSKENEKSSRKNLLVSVVGIGLNILMIVINSFAG